MDVLGRSSQALTGEIGLSEFQNVFAEVSICPETMELLQKSSRETHFEATATCFEYSMESQGSPRGAPGNPLRIPAESAGILGMWGLGPGNISTKDKYYCPYTKLENLNQKILAVPLKNGNRCFKMRFAGQFFLLRCSFPTISMRLQKRF